MELAPGHEAWFPLLGPPLGFEFESTSETRSVDTDEIPSALGRLTLALLDGFLDGPSLWIAENAHLADEASAAVIGSVVKELGQRPWLIVAVSRDDERAGLAAVEGATVTVGPLAEEAGVRLARTANPAMLPHDASVIAERADGNPLFLRQLVSAAASGGELSDSVETAVSARIDQLSTVDRDVLRTASVLGGRFEPGDLRELLNGRSPDLAPLQDFVTTVEGAVVFRQALYREVAYAGLTFKRRRALHLAAGRLLESEAADDKRAYARLSLHFDRAQAWEASWKYSRIAAEDAFITIAKSLAAELWERALQAGRHLPDVTPEELASAAADWGKSLFHAGRQSEALAAYRLGRRLAPKGTAVLADLELAEGALHHDFGRMKQARPWLQRAIATLDASGLDMGALPQAETAVSALCGLADVQLRAGRVTEAQELAARATVLAKQSKYELLIGRAHTVGLFIAVNTGDLEKAIEEGTAALEAHRTDDRYKSSMAVQAMNLGALKQMTGDWLGARAMHDEAYATLHNRGEDKKAATCQLNIVEILIDQGKWDEASATLDEVAPLFDEGEEESDFVRAHRIQLAVRTGCADHAEPPSEMNSFGLPEIVYGTLIEAALSRGDRTEAMELLAKVDEDELDLPHRLVLEAMATGGSLDAALQACIDTDKRFAAVLARVVLGGDLEADPDAHALGIVDVPAWAKANPLPG